MTTEDIQYDSRRIDLLVARATVGLSPQEADELDRLLAAEPDFDEDAFEQAVALIDRSFEVDALEPMPEALEQELLAKARALSASPASRSGVAPVEGGSAGSPRTVIPINTAEPAPTRSAVFAWSGWLAAAAALGFALVGWWAALNPDVRADRPLPERYARFVDSAPNLVQSTWSPNVEDLSGVTGDVVWSDDEQAGFMRFVGLPVNDPQKMQYQLWIVDQTRDQNPIDGGVFDINDKGEVIIPFGAKLPAEKPSVFAITREKPGGVVVSAGPLALIAATS